MSLPRYAIVITDDSNQNDPCGGVMEVDDVSFFQALSQLDARDPNILQGFMDTYRFVKIKVSGLSDCISFHEQTQDCPDFEQFSVDLWKEFYIQEGIIQIGVLEDKEPSEVRLSDYLKNVSVIFAFKILFFCAKFSSFMYGA